METTNSIGSENNTAYLYVDRLEQWAITRAVWIKKEEENSALFLYKLFCSFHEKLFKVGQFIIVVV